MKVSLWAEIRRLREIERLSKNAIARQLGCCHKTVGKALAMDEPPRRAAHPPRTSKLDGHKTQIDQLIARYPKLSAVRILEEIAKATTVIGAESPWSETTCVRFVQPAAGFTKKSSTIPARLCKSIGASAIG